ncbi:MAG: hypothetical protein H7Z42_09180, partial [Roseiflexaceae bacterium]|nr:hypothetical protein [Roseiflexaceae bacterium]
MNARHYSLIAAASLCLLLLLGPAGRLATVSMVLLFAPGYLAARLLPGPELATPFARPAIWLGLSISLIALLYQWATTLGLALSQPALTALAVLCGGAALADWGGAR